MLGWGWAFWFHPYFTSGACRMWVIHYKSILLWYFCRPGYYLNVEIRTPKARYWQLWQIWWKRFLWSQRKNKNNCARALAPEVPQPFLPHFAFASGFQAKCTRDDFMSSAFFLGTTVDSFSEVAFVVVVVIEGHEYRGIRFSFWRTNPVFFL